MHFDGKDVIGVLFLSWILMGSKPLVTKTDYSTVLWHKNVQLKIDKCFLVCF